MKLSSHNKTILVFADPHQEIDKVRKIMLAEQPDVSLCLGDWFDSFTHNSEFDLEKTCRFLKENLFQKNFVTLMGNHDVQYLYENFTILCSGYARVKDVFISDSFGSSSFPVLRSKFPWYIWVDDFLCTHAGLSPIHLLPNQKLGKAAISEWLDEQIKFATIALETQQRYWLYGAGRVRGGPLPKGGIDWLDFNDEFEPIPGLKQIVGHTESDCIRGHRSDTCLDISLSKNLDIDCGLREYLIIRNKKITIKKFIDL